MTSLKALLPYFRAYRAELVIGLTFVLLSSATSSVLPWLLRSAMDSIGTDSAVVRNYAIAIVVVAIVGGSFRFGMRLMLNGVSRKVELDLRDSLFRRLLTLDASWYARNRIGDTMARLTNDLSAVRMAAGPAIMYLVSTVFGGLFALIFMLRIHAGLTLLAILPMLLLPVVMVRLGSAIHRRFEAVQEHFSTLTVRAQENISGVRVVRAYVQERAELDRFAVLNEEYVRRNLALAHLWGLMNPLFALLAGTGGAVVLLMGGTLVLQDAITVGDFVAFTFYLAQLTWPLIALGWVINLFQRGAASMLRLQEILDAQSSIADPPEPLHLAAQRGGRAIELRNVSFRYPGTDEGDTPLVLRDISFSLKPGQVAGVVGATGSGKSALMDLLPRLFDPTTGEILVDGVPVRMVKVRDLRREIGYASQESILFSDTIDYNIRYGIAGEEAARNAAAISRLDEAVERFPSGYDTLLGERGINLSGGQKQRLSLARAVAREPSILLLDDTLSAVDTLTEAEILSRLQGALRGRTTLIATHRVSAVRNADVILVLHEGVIVERGTHEELLQLNGRYALLWRRQQLEESIESAGTDATAVISAEAPPAAGDGENA